MDLETLFDQVSRRRRTAENLVTDVLREAILRGLLPPGERLGQDELAERLNVSRMPIRQAMRALEAEGLVRTTPHRGVVVSQLSIPEIEEIYEMRVELEGLAMRRAVPNMTRGHLTAIRGQLEAMESNTDHVRYLEANARLHEMLLSPSNRPRLVKLTTNLRTNVDRYIRLSVSMPDAFAQSRREHWEVLAACEQGNAQAAERLIQQHVSNAARVVVEILRQKQEN